MINDFKRRRCAGIAISRIYMLHDNQTIHEINTAMRVTTNSYFIELNISDLLIKFIIEMCFN